MFWKKNLLTIRVYPDPVLREKSAPITEITDEIRELAEKMLPTMRDADGVGLAAPQVGVNIRMIALNEIMQDDLPEILINPEIISKSKDKETESEGCLSLPGLNAQIIRFARVTVKALTIDGEEVEIQAEELLARALQHEIDHLDGILFTDRASTAAKISLNPELERMESEFIG